MKPTPFASALSRSVFSIHEDEDGEDVLAIANEGEVPADLAAGVRDAVDRCPKMALTLEE